MVYTTHGHHIPGTVKGGDHPYGVARCGGVGVCKVCTDETRMVVGTSGYSTRLDLDDTPAVPQNETTDYPARAKEIVRKYVTPRQSSSTLAFEVYVIWFTKTLQNWKAVLGTTIPGDIQIYEVTYNGDKREAYLDVYEKTENIVIPD